MLTNMDSLIEGTEPNSIPKGASPLSNPIKEEHFSTKD
jgi:hypothetical protein